MSAEREEMPMEGAENVEKEAEEEGDSESSDDSGDEETVDNPRITELETQVQNLQDIVGDIEGFINSKSLIFRFWAGLRCRH